MWLHILKKKGVKDSISATPPALYFFQKWASLKPTGMCVSVHVSGGKKGDGGAHVCVCVCVAFYFFPLLFYTLLLTPPLNPFPPFCLAFCPKRNHPPHDRCNSISVKKRKSSLGQASDKSMAVISHRQLQGIFAESVSLGKQTNKHKKAEQKHVSCGHKIK